MQIPLLRLYLTVVSHLRKIVRNIIFSLIILLFSFNSKAQSDSLKTDFPSFNKMLVGTENIYALENDGRLSIWNISSLEKVFNKPDTIPKYTSIAKDKNNGIFLGTEKGKIYKLNKNNLSKTLFLKLKKELKISDIFFNSSNEIFLIVPYAIYDPIKDKYWDDFKHEANGMVVQKRFLFFFRKRVDTYFDMPQYTFIDSNDRIWMTKSWGEFGGSVQIFDTKKRKELEADIESLDFGLLFPKSVFEDNKQNIYVTSGLQHFGNSGEIYKIEDNHASLIYDSADFKDKDESAFGGGIFVGPGQYNKKEEKIYFATTDGFYKADIPKNSKILNPEFVFKPDLIWEREPLAIGVQMSIKEIDFTNDNRLVFLTSNNGIGIYDNGKLIMLK